MIASPSPPPPDYTTRPTLAARNAIPTGARAEGMTVYVVATQVTYQLLPPPWEGTDDDWVEFGQIPAFTPPQLLELWMEDTDDETVPIDEKWIGKYQAVNAAISGDVTFQWDALDGTGIVDGTISLTLDPDTTPVVLATGLSMTDEYHGRTTVTLPAPITRASPGTRTIRLSGTSTKGVVYTLDLVTTWVTPTDADYYVATTGNDSNPGTEGSPWLTIQRAINDGLGPGDTVHIATGTYAAGGLLVANTNGCQGHPITFQGVAGTRITGVVGSGFSKAAISATNCSFIHIDTIHADLTGLDADSSASGFFFGGFWGDQAYGCKVTNCEIEGGRLFGILTGFLSFGVVENCDIHDFVNVGNTRGHALYPGNSCFGFVTRGNYFHDMPGDGIHPNGDAEAGGPGVTMDQLIDGNRIINCNANQGGGGINADGTCRSTFQNNLIRGVAQTAAGISLYVASSAVPSRKNVICNNTVVTNTTNRGALHANVGSNANVIFNNVFYANNGICMLFSEDAIPDTYSNYNAFGGAFSNDDGVSIFNLTTWQNAIFRDADSVDEVPLSILFMDPSSNDFRAAYGSPLVDAGTAAGGLGGEYPAPTTDILGNPRPVVGGWDIGAYEQPDVLVVTEFSPNADAVGVPSDAVVYFTFNRAVDVTTVTISFTGPGGAVASTRSYNADTRTVTFTPDDPLDDGVHSVALLTAETPTDVAVTDPPSWDFTVSTIDPGDIVNLFGEGVYALIDDDDSAVTSGLRFRPDVNGTIVGVRFYKNVNDTGTHVGRICSVDQTTGDRVADLATVTFVGETASGWQEQLFGGGVAVTAGTVYQMNVYRPNGRSSYIGGNFSGEFTNGPLTALQSSGSGNTGNGKYVYGLGINFPNASFNDTDYGVDVMFVPDA